MSSFVQSCEKKLLVFISNPTLYVVDITSPDTQVTILLMFVTHKAITTRQFASVELLICLIMVALVILILVQGLMCSYATLEWTSVILNSEAGPELALMPLDKNLNGHGIHVAGTVGGRKFGVATDCNIISVKVLNGTGHGSVNAIVRGMMYKWEEILRRKTDTGEKRKVVVNMSLGVKGRSDEIEKYVSRVTREGAPVVPSPGNDQTDACLFTPAWMPLAITVWQDTTWCRQTTCQLGIEA